MTFKCSTGPMSPEVDGDRLLEVAKAAWEAPAAEVGHLMLRVLHEGSRHVPIELKDGRVVQFATFKEPSQADECACVLYVDARFWASIGAFRRGEDQIMHQEWKISLSGGGAVPDEAMLAVAAARPTGPAN